MWMCSTVQGCQTVGGTQAAKSYWRSGLSGAEDPSLRSTSQEPRNQWEGRTRDHNPGMGYIFRPLWDWPGGCQPEGRWGMTRREDLWGDDPKEEQAMRWVHGCSIKYVGKAKTLWAAHLKEPNSRRWFLTSPFGIHRIAAHNGVDNEVKFSILSQRETFHQGKPYQAMFLLPIEPLAKTYVMWKSSKR